MEKVQAEDALLRVRLQLQAVSTAGHCTLLSAGQLEPRVPNLGRLQDVHVL